MKVKRGKEQREGGKVVSPREQGEAYLMRKVGTSNLRKEQLFSKQIRGAKYLLES